MPTAAARALALAISALLLLAACGEDGPSGQPLEPAAAPEPAAEPPEEPIAEPPPAPSETGPAEPEPPPPPPPSSSLADIVLEEIAVLDQPLELAARPGDERLYVAEKGGRVRVVAPDGSIESTPFLDLSDRVSTESERGLLGITFSPDGSRFYAHYSDRSGSGRLASWALDGDALDPRSELDILEVRQPFSNHNGGQIAFGPDGFLYWGLGDGGSAGDPEQNGQDPSTLLGSILRIEPTTDPAEPYRVPPDNPFVERSSARGEVWVWGLRNPWKFSFDADGGLWIGDVGQNALEEIDFLPAGEAAGANLGWNALEGTAPFEGEAPAGAVAPVFEYSHEAGVSVTGGYVYAGNEIPALVDSYVFGDFGSGFIAALALEDGEWRARRLPVEVPQLASFGVDAAGELYALSLSGRSIG